MKLCPTIENVDNLQYIVQEYFEELMTVHSIVYKFGIHDINVNDDVKTLNVIIYFDNEDDCECIEAITNNIDIFRYGVSLNISNSLISPLILSISCTKN